MKVRLYFFIYATCLIIPSAYADDKFVGSFTLFSNVAQETSFTRIEKIGDEYFLTDMENYKKHPFKIVSDHQLQDTRGVFGTLTLGTLKIEGRDDVPVIWGDFSYEKFLLLRF